jgi:hypothetical protein
MVAPLLYYVNLWMYVEMKTTMECVSVKILKTAAKRFPRFIAVHEKPDQRAQIYICLQRSIVDVNKMDTLDYGTLALAAF